MTTDVKHVLNHGQHDLFAKVNMCCTVLTMNLGSRIKKRLEQLGWERSRLIELVPDLTPANLSALIRRDSKRSEFDEEIAKALGVSLLWLVYGHDEEREPPRLEAMEARRAYGPPALTDDEQLLLTAYRAASDDAKSAVLIWAKSVTPPSTNERRAGAA